MYMRDRPSTVGYELYKTNADLEAVKFLGRSRSRDILETIMMNRFTQSNYEEDFFVIDQEDHQNIIAVFSDRSHSLRGGCIG